MKQLLLLTSFLLYPISSLAYTHLSPYSYCGGNPVNCIDPNGKDIVVLNYTEGEHMAMLIQNKDGKWQYYSVNGNNIVIPIIKKHIGGRPFNDVAVGSWDSPQEFLDSSYNVKTGNSKNDESMNHYGFSEGYQISTTPEQDETMRNSFSRTAKTKYNPISNNCTTAVQKAMVEAGIPVSEPTVEPSYIPISTPFGIEDVFNGNKIKCDFKIMPSSAFNGFYFLFNSASVVRLSPIPLKRNVKQKKTSTFTIVIRAVNKSSMNLDSQKNY